ATGADLAPDGAPVRAADGRIVGAGVVDVPTHYGAQPFWDGTLSPSPLHGVTTVIGGNCGFTIAPLSDDPADGEYLMRMLSRVEGMPLESLLEGVPWDWKSTAEFLDAGDPLLAINAGYKVGHSALRRVVMGEDAVQREATDAEVAAMADLLRAGLAAGAMGFSSTWSTTHNDADGRPVPSRHASRIELIDRCSVLVDFPGTGLEFLPGIGGPVDSESRQLLTDMSLAAGGRQLNWNVMQVTAGNVDECLLKLEAGTHAAERGAKVVALTVPMLIAARLSFASGFVLDAIPGWADVMFLPREEKKRILADPVQRRRLDALAQGDHPLRRLANWGALTIFDTVNPVNSRFDGRTVAHIAAELGCDPFDALLDIALADELQTSFGRADEPSSREDWEARVRIWRDGRAVIGASDAGAHLDLLATFNYPTRVLAEPVRQHGLLELEEAVHLMTAVQADLYGLVDRGRLHEGAHADVLLIDETAVDSNPVTMRPDLPGGAARLYAGASGIDEVLVAGIHVVEAGTVTRAPPRRGRRRRPRPRRNRAGHRARPATRPPSPGGATTPTGWDPP
ncbi:MAG: amidohydrolase family protein, partial [Actinobacteria bacterium]|nr:amidohydrolase family protein [Actinomycetota bacterium]